MQRRKISRRVNVLRIAMNLCEEDIRPTKCQILSSMLSNTHLQLLNNFLRWELFISPRLSELILRRFKGSKRLVSLLLRRFEPILQINYPS